MKARYLAALVVAAGFNCGLALAGDVGVSISIGQPGFYGRIDLGNAPQPMLIYPQPVLINRVAVVPAPIYLRVAPGHERDWGRHCRHYKACGRPVYFVRDDWYRDVYVPHYREHGHEHGRDGAQGEGREHGNKNKDKERRGHGENRD